MSPSQESFNKMDWSKTLAITTVSAMLIKSVKEIFSQNEKIEFLEQENKRLQDEINFIKRNGLH